MPLFYFDFESVAYKESSVTHSDVVKFIKYVIDRMQLCTECIVISLIYIEKLMQTSKIEIRNINWKPLMFTAILLASKFWEDINFWNVDYVEGLDLYPLKAINRMESEFLSLCNYNIYVSASNYITYSTQIQALNKTVEKYYRQRGSVADSVGGT